MKKKILKVLISAALLTLVIGNSAYATEGLNTTATEKKSISQSNVTETKKSNTLEYLEKAAKAKLNEFTYNTMSEKGEQHLYKFNMPKGKITAYLKCSSSKTNLDLYLLKYDEASDSIAVVASSTYGADNYEQLSNVNDGGDYYILVNDNSTSFEEAQYGLALLHSDKYDGNEADDNVNSRTVYDAPPDLLGGTIDNNLDEDWLQFTVDKSQSLYANFQNSSTKENLVMQLYDSNFNCIGTLEQNHHISGQFDAGIYYIKVVSKKGFDADNYYNINFINMDKFNKRKIIGNGEDIAKENLDNSKDSKWYEYSVEDINQIVELSLVMDTTNAYYVADVYDRNMNYAGTFKPGEFARNTFKNTGKYYVRVRSLKGYDANVKYELKLDRYDSNSKIK